MSKEQEAIQRLGRVQRSLGSAALSDVQVTSEEGKGLLASLLASAGSADFSAETMRENIKDSLKNG